MLPAALRRRKPAQYRTAIDGELVRRTGLDELSLRRLRRQLDVRYGALSYRERLLLVERGAPERLRFLNEILRECLSAEQWGGWLRYIEHTEKDVAEMERGEYPVSPYLVRLYSALFGIRVDFLLVGHEPAPDPRGVSIDIWPPAGAGEIPDGLGGPGRPG